MKRRLTALFSIVALGLLCGHANAATFIFKGDGNTVTPMGVEGVNYTRNCGTVGADYCSAAPHTAGLLYALDGITLTAKAYAAGLATRIIQDIFPGDSGLGAFSENNSSDDQTQFDSGESIEFVFDRSVTVADVEFNAGGDVNCSNFGAEGECGMFNLTIDDVFLGAFAAEDLVAFLGTGTKFLIEAITAGAGFTIAAFSASSPAHELPIPSAFTLLAAGLAGLGFAVRRGLGRPTSR